MVVLKERFLHRVLNRFNIHHAFAARAQLFLHAVHNGFHIVVVFPRGGGRQRHRADDKFTIILHNIAVPLPDLHVNFSLVFILADNEAQKTQHLVVYTQKVAQYVDYSTAAWGSQRRLP